MAASIELADLTIDPVWCDSLGAKSTCFRLETPDTSLTIDPGVAAMQPGYPLPDELKGHHKREAEERIRAAVRDSEHVAISHYHHDHYLAEPSLYAETDAQLWLKDPNRWINDSQWDRARELLAGLAAEHDEDLVRVDPAKSSFCDPYEDFERAQAKDFGDYQDRREELLAKWRSRYEDRVERWCTTEWIEEPSFAAYADGETVEAGDTRIRFLGPWFHGIEYAGTGWVLPTIVETPETTFLHSSDLQGPTIEDYAERIVELDPDVLFLDGPATYMLGPMLNWTNLQRSIDNAAHILREVDPDVMIFDHHLLRERKYRERTSEVWELREEGYNVQTVAELLGEEPMIDRASRWSEEDKQARVEELASG